MKHCVVPGCRSRGTNKISYYSLPGSADRHIARRRLWQKALYLTRIPENYLKHVKICSKHFVTGHPGLTPQSVDWVPSVNLPFCNLKFASVERIASSVRKIITNLPEVTEEFDMPEYITLDKVAYNEQQIESALIKYFTNPICDENGYYRNDHDYLGLPFAHTKTEQDHVKTHEEHNYSMLERPACFYSDLRYFCNICQYNTLNLFTFNMHMMSHTIKNDVTCLICTKRFLTTTCLNTHMISHFTICDLCGMEVPIVQLKAHQQPNWQQKERFLSPGYQVTPDQKVSFCIFCMRTFHERRMYLGHVRRHHLALKVPKHRNLKTVRKEVFAPVNTNNKQH